MNNAKRLEKAVGIFEKIRALDAEIIEIDRFAMMAANDDLSISFTMEVENISQKKSEEEKVSLDDDGSLQYGVHNPHRMIFSFGGLMSACSYPGEVKKAYQHNLKATVSNQQTLMILGFLLQDKQSKRTALINQLAGLGFQI